jgi:hypothetical protein
MHGLTIGGAEIDHIDGNPLNNAISNLRLATKTQQQQNTRVRARNRSGLKGAIYHTDRKVWTSRIKVDGKRIFLGTFHTAEEAHDAYCEAATKYFGTFARVA